MTHDTHPQSHGFRSLSALDAPTRRRVTDALAPLVREGIALQLAAKVAHWNVRGPGFAALHAFFEQIAGAVAGHVDDVAERLVMLGGLAPGSASEAAQAGAVARYPSDVTRDLLHVALLADAAEEWLSGLRRARVIAAESSDGDTEDLLTGVITSVEKLGWQLRATLA